jgi:hypothetical protein
MSEDPIRAAMELRWINLQPGIYCRSRSQDLQASDSNDMMDVDLESVFDVLMFNNNVWYYLDEETWGWELCDKHHDPTAGRVPLIKITGPDLSGVMATRLVRV